MKNLNIKLTEKEKGDRLLFFIKRERPNPGKISKKVACPLFPGRYL